MYSKSVQPGDGPGVASCTVCGNVQAAALSPNGRSLFTRTDSEFALYAVADDWGPNADNGAALSQKAVWPLSAFDFGRTLAWSPQGDRIAFETAATISIDTRVVVLDLHSGKRSPAENSQEGRVWEIAWSPDGKHIVSMGDDLYLRYHIADGKDVMAHRSMHFTGLGSNFRGLAWGPGHTVALTDNREVKQVKVVSMAGTDLDPVTGMQLPLQVVSVPHTASAVAWADDHLVITVRNARGNKPAADPDETALYLADPAGQLVGPLLTLRGNVTRLSVVPRGNGFAALVQSSNQFGGISSRLDLVDLQKLEVVWSTPAGTRGAIQSASWAGPDELRVLQDNRIRAYAIPCPAVSLPPVASAVMEL